MDRIRARPLGRVKDGGGVQVAFPRRRGADADRLVGGAHMKSAGVGVGENRDGPVAHRLCRSRNTACYLAAVRDEDLSRRLRVIPAPLLNVSQ